MTILILAIAALLTSIVSAILGMAGGVMLLAIMLCFLPHAEAIPTHAAVQIASNGTRVLAFLREVDRGAFGRFVLGAIPGGSIGLLLLWLLGEPEASEPYLKTIVGAYVLLATWLPVKRTKGATPGKWWDFPLMGLAAGAAALTVGAVGPLITPLFARRDFVKERLIATKAACQLALHVVKIPAFLWLRRPERRQTQHVGPGDDSDGHSRHADRQANLNRHQRAAFHDRLARGAEHKWSEGVRR